MDTEFLLKIMAVFTGVAAVALVIMMAAMLGIFRAVNLLKDRASKFMDTWEPVAKSSQETLDQLREQSSEVLTKVSELTTATQGQVGKVETLVTQLSETAHKNISRVDEAMKKTLDRVDDTTAAVERTIRIPADQLRAIGAGVNAAVQHLMKGKPSQIDRIAADEEMFI